MEIRGLSNGLDIFLVEVRVFTQTKDGYEGTTEYPTFWTVGGNGSDAIKNAESIVKPWLIPDVYEWVTRATPADPDAPYYEAKSEASYSLNRKIVKAFNQHG